MYADCQYLLLLLSSFILRTLSADHTGTTSGVQEWEQDVLEETGGDFILLHVRTLRSPRAPHTLTLRSPASGPGVLN